MPLQVIYSESLKNVRPVIYYGQTIFSRSVLLKSLLGNNLGNEFKNLFTDPFISDDAMAGRADASWLSDYISSVAKPLTALSADEQNLAKAKLLEMLEKINNLAESFLQSPSLEVKQQGEILKKAIEIPGFDYVFVEGEKLALVCWGFSSEIAERNKFQISKALISDIQTFVPNLENKIPNQKTPKSEKENVNIDEISEDNNKTAENKQESKPLASDNNANSEKNANYNPQANNNNNYTPPPYYPANNKKKFPWWILLIILFLLLMLIAILLTRKFICNKAFLPDKPNKYAPIDPGKIIPDPDDKFKRPIVSNRLILCVKKKSKYKSIYEFAEVFNKDFSSSGCSVVSYDTIAKTLSIEFPEEKRKQIKSEIRAKYNDILIIDEAIFQQNQVPSDLGFSDNEKSWFFKTIKAYDAWQITKGNPSVIVAIIDNGFDANHKEFEGKIAKTWNVISYTEQVNTGKVNMTHGTHVAGIVAANANNGVGVSGIAPDCKLMLIQVGDEQGNMSTGGIINGILYAINNGANVINMSLGMNIPENIQRMTELEQENYVNQYNTEEAEFWNELFSYANDNNTTIVLAGGNSNVLIGIDPMDRSDYSIKVSASDPSNIKAPFSNYGKFSNVSAPGVHIYSSLPNNKFDYMDGTSMAAPVITGAVALAKSLNPDIETSQLKAIMESTGIKPASKDKFIGNIIQLDAFLEAVKSSNNADCKSIRKKIDSLKQVINDLEKQCIGGGTQLIIPDNAKDLKFVEGKWKASNDIVNEKKERVAVYFDLEQSGSGKMSLVEPSGNTCSGKVSVKLIAGNMSITQTENATCKDGKFFQKYDFECKPEKDNIARCFAKNQKQESNNFNFTLFKQ